jgi:peptide/nickel transport system permease protein
MLLQILRRTGTLVASLVVSSMLVFVFMALLPGDPARVALGVNASEASVAQLRQEFGLDRPLVSQYLSWMGGFVRFDLGTSYVSQAAIAPQIIDRLQVTLWLVVCSMVLALVIAVPFGTVMALRHRRPSGLVLSALSQVGVAVPAFLAGILLITIFAVKLQWLPANGWTPPNEDPVQFVRQLILPVLALGLVQGAVLTRYVRSSVLDVQREDYIRTARAKGLPERTVIGRHALRAGLSPIVTAAGLDLAGLLGGAIVIEPIFALPGIGRLSLDAVITSDLPVITGTVMVAAFFIIVANLVVDLLYAVIDPRVRLA